MPVNIGELLLKEKVISPQQVQDTVEYQKLNGGKLSKALVTLGFVKDPEITSLLSVHYDVPSIDLERFEVDPAMIRIIPGATVRKHQVLPLSLTEGTLTVARPSRASASSRTRRSPACCRGTTASPRSTSTTSRSIPPSSGSSPRRPRRGAWSSRSRAAGRR